MSFSDNKDGYPLYPVSSSGFEGWYSGLASIQQKWLKAAGFQGKAGEV